MSILDEFAVSLLKFFEKKAMDWDISRVPQPARRSIWSRRMHDLRRKFERR